MVDLGCGPCPHYLLPRLHVETGQARSVHFPSRPQAFGRDRVWRTGGGITSSQRVREVVLELGRWRGAPVCQGTALVGRGVS